jgi:hypothetical protein
MVRVTKDDDRNPEEGDWNRDADGREAETREGELPPDPGSWELYANAAISALYPNLRDGVDYTWSRPPDSTVDVLPSMLYWSDKLAPADMVEIQRVAEKLRDEDPYGPNAPEPPVTYQSPRTTDPGVPEYDDRNDR